MLKGISTGIGVALALPLGWLLFWWLGVVTLRFPSAEDKAIGLGFGRTFDCGLNSWPHHSFAFVLVSFRERISVATSRLNSMTSQNVKSPDSINSPIELAGPRGKSMEGSDGQRGAELFKKSRRTFDFLLLLGSALLLAALLTATFWVADSYHINSLWVFAAWASLLFLIVIGWGYRTKFKSPAFASFFVAWMLVHALLYVSVLYYLGFVYYVPLSILELWVGYTLAIWLFGPPPQIGLR